MDILKSGNPTNSKNPPTWNAMQFCFLFSLSGSLLILPEWVVVGFRNLAWAHSQKYWDSHQQQKSVTPPTPRTMTLLGRQGWCFQKVDPGF